MATEPPWERVDALVAKLLPLGPAEREGVLGRECAGQPELRAEVESLLAWQARARAFLEPGSSPLRAAAEGDGGDPWIGRRTGGFELRARIGRGGMGRVYEAWQEQPGRRVAVKVLGPLARAADVRRFEVEAEVLGRLHHPAIAQLYASGVIDDPLAGELPWFAMELVEDAEPLTGHARGLGRDARLELFLAVCDGVQDAHRHGVLHRDLKPSNLLVGRDGRPRIIDFGIARTLGEGLGESRVHTRTGEVLGTLQYMSPEQCSEESVDARSDVYSLGLVLYELVTGEVAQDLADTTLYEALRIIREEPPPRPSAVDQEREPSLYSRR